MLPDFLILGAARSATTSLHYYLAQHPSIAMSLVKEPNYFSFDHEGHPLIEEPRIIKKSVPSRAAYERLFPTARSQVLGEASPLYLYTHGTPELIAEAIPDARLIAVVREPIARAYSHFRYVYPDLGERTLEAFAEALTYELPLPDSPYRSGTHNLRLGRYAPQLSRFLDYFPKDQLLVLSFDDVSTDPAGTLAAICRFVGVDANHRFDISRRYADSARAGSRIDRLLAPAVPHLKRTLPPRLAGALARERSIRRADRSVAVAEPAVPSRVVPARSLPANLLGAVEDYFAESNAMLADTFGITFR